MTRLDIYREYGKRGFIEVTIITLIYLAVGYALDKNDPLIIKEDGFTPFILLSILTLFYGTLHSSITLFTLLVANIYFYDKADEEFFLKEIFTILLMGEFHYRWNKAFSIYKNKSKALEEKLEELGNKFYALKISHDQMEFDYILRPISIRKLIEDISKKREMRERIQEFILLIAKLFNINKIIFCRYYKDIDEYYVVANAGDAKFFKDDPLVKEAIAKKRPIYVSEYEDNISKYLAILPYNESQNTIGLLIIKDMSFLSFNYDNLSAIAFLFDYYLLRRKKIKTLKSDNICLFLDDDFRYELIEQRYFFKKYRVKSSLIVIKTKSKLIAHQLEDIAQKRLRSLDKYTVVEINDYYTVLLLLPLSNKPSAKALLKRIEKEIAQESKIQTTIFSMEELDICREFVNDKFR